MKLQDHFKPYQSLIKKKNLNGADALAAVKEDGFALRFVQNQTEEICLAAVEEDWYALRFVRNQTEETCLAAVKENGFALQYVDNQTEEICLAAVKQNGYALQYVDESMFGQVKIIIDGKEIFISRESANALKEQL